MLHFGTTLSTSRHHEPPKSTPLIDAIGAVVAVASVVIGGYAGLFLFTAAMAGRWDTAADCALFFVFIAVGNAIVDAARHWSRHHDSLLDRRPARRNARRP